MAQREYTRSPVTTRREAAVVDRGLQAYMSKVYALMTGAMILTGLVAYVVGMDFRAVVNQEPTTVFPPEMIVAMFSSPIRWVIMFAPLIFVFAFSAMINRMSASTAQLLFWVFGAVMGLSVAWIFAVFTGMSIAQTFFATAAGFGALSIWGYTTGKDLSGWGSFLLMGLIGLIVAMFLNIWLASEALQWAISIIGVLLFAGLTAYDTQSIKNEYLAMRGAHGGEEYLGRSAVMGALRLYLDFLNMFMFLLQFMGNRE
jgi:FtsH-binding integral membrane protein